MKGSNVMGIKAILKILMDMIKRNLLLFFTAGLYEFYINVYDR